MQTPQQTYRYSGLIAVLGLATLLVALIVMLLLPGIRFVGWYILLLGIVLLAVAFVMDFRAVGRAVSGRRGRLRAGTTVMVSIVIGITLVANAISIGNYQRFDLTGLAQFTLTLQTKELLSQMEQPVQALLFSTPNDPYGIGIFADSLLTEYQNYTDKLSIKQIDPDEYPEQARQYGVTLYPSVVFDSNNLQKLVSAQEISDEAEYAFTSAILEVTGIVQKKVYFLTGHGEADINSTASTGYSRAMVGLLDNLYKVERLDLALTPEIPEDAAALIIAAPRRPLPSSEIEIIERYLQNKGWVLLLTNPNPSPDINQLLAPWKVVIEDGIVIDNESFVAPNKESPKVPRVRNQISQSEVYLPGATAILTQEETPEGMERLALLWTSQDSWLEKDFDANEEPEFDEGRDTKGPMAVGVLIFTQPDEKGKMTRLVIIGDSDFAANQHFFNATNSDLFLNSVNLLTVGKELISIDRKVLPFRRLVVGPEAYNFINYSSIALLPILVLLAGGIIWWRRR